MDSRPENVYKNLNTARKFHDCCVANLGERTQYEWTSEGWRVEYNRRHFIWISQQDVQEAIEIPRNIKTWVPPAGKKGTQALHGVRSTHRSMFIQVGKVGIYLDIFPKQRKQNRM
jgi:hypothetical protein